jgi:Ca2+-binding RTX toxin-like protein
MTRTRHARRHPHLEPLELRRLLSAAVDGAGVLTVTGSAANDTITLSPGPNPGDVSVTGAPDVAAGTVFTGVTRAVVQALAGNDAVTAFPNLLTPTGTPLPTRLEGGAGNDTLTGGTGDDTLVGGAGNDSLDGGPGGNDTADYSAAASSVTVDLRRGRATRDGDRGRDSLRNIDAVTGSNFNDNLTGDDNPNTLSGGAGNDRIDGRGADDSINGGAGDDRITDRSGNNHVSADDGRDNVDTGNGNDSVSGGNGDDRLTDSGGNNDVSGDDGNDTLTLAGTGASSVFGGNGNDRIRSANGRETVRGGAGNDDINAGSGDDDVEGGDGNDRIDAGRGSNRVRGNDGADDIRKSTGRNRGGDDDVVDEPSGTVADREPNNTKAQATPFALGSDNTVQLTGTSTSSSDDDFFIFTAEATGTLTAAVQTAAGTTTFAQVEIEDPASAKVLETDPANGTNTATGQVTAGQTYAVRLRAPSTDPAAYAVTLTLAPAGSSGGTVPAGAVSESEPNDTPAAANPFALDSGNLATLSGTADGKDDRDFFRFTAPSAGALTATLRSTNGTLAKLEIEDASGHEALELQPNDGQTTGTFQLVAGRTYFVRLRSASSSPAAYALDLSLNPTDTTTGTTTTTGNDDSGNNHGNNSGRDDHGNHNNDDHHGGGNHS